MKRLILAFKVDSKFQQVQLDEGFTFERSGYFRAVVRNPQGDEVFVPLASRLHYTVVLDGEKAYMKTFESPGNLEACNAAVPDDAIVVVIKGTQGQNAIVFEGGGKITAVQNDGKYQANIGGDNSSVQIGDGNTMNFNF